MRCVYMSDLHLEGQDFGWPVPEGDVLILAGDMCHAACLAATRMDPYAVRQRDRVLRLIERAGQTFRHVLAIAGNHEHYDGVFEDTAGIMQAHLPGVRVLDNDSVEIGGVAFFGTTLWSDFEGRSLPAIEAARKGMGEYFFAKTREHDGEGRERLVRLGPQATLDAHDASLAALGAHLAARDGEPTVVVSHHAPSRKGLNALHMGNPLDGAYASALDGMIAGLESVPFWVHGHTHVVAAYTIGRCRVVANCRGFGGREVSGRGFRPDRSFEV